MVCNQSQTDQGVAKTPISDSATESVAEKHADQSATVAEQRTTQTLTSGTQPAETDQGVAKKDISQTATPSVAKTETPQGVIPLGETLTAEETIEMVDRLCDLNTTPTTIHVLCGFSSNTKTQN